MSSLPFRCGCGRYIDEKRWKKLPAIGYGCMEADWTGPEEHLEYRNCKCGSTRAIEVGPHHQGCTLPTSRRR